ncbi:MAG TPA: LLM class flavin-dependent oxidoreductase [Gemmatimonadaceae bacterium]
MLRELATAADRMTRDPVAPLRLSVLDQSPIAEGSTGAHALHNSIDLARLTDALGFHRYWVAEHHGTPMLACASPEVLIGPIAAATTRLRVGSGGVMLPHYSPFKVAENFSMLSALFPGRIDIGLGRAAGTDPATTFALQRDRRGRSPDDFPQQLVELLAYFQDRIPADDLFARLATILPGRPDVPDPWLLGSSPQSGIWAAQLGLPYAFADFINPLGAEIAARYREEFVASERQPEPHIIVAAWVICAETDAEAERLASSSQMAFTLLHRGQLVAVPPVETALRFLDQERTRTDAARDALQRARRKIVGSPAVVRDGIRAVAREYGADEVMIVTITYEHAARRQSYELIAEAFGVPRA